MCTVYLTGTTVKAFRAGGASQFLLLTVCLLYATLRVMAALRLRVKDLRERQGKSQSELALEAGISRQALIAIEKGATKGVDFSTLEQLARALGVEAGHLIATHRSKPTK